MSKKNKLYSAKRQHRSMLFGFTVSYALLILIPIFMGGIHYWNSFHLIRTQVEYSNSLILEHSVKAMENSLDTMTEFAKTIQSSSAIAGFSKEYPSQLNLLKLQEAVWDLTKLEDNNHYVNHYYLYLKRPEIILAPKQVFLQLAPYYSAVFQHENLSLEKWKDTVLDNIPPVQQISPTGPIAGLEQQQNLLYQIPYYNKISPFPVGQLLFAIDGQKVQDSLKPAYDLGATFMYILDQEENILVKMEQEGWETNLDFLHEESELSLSSQKINGEQMLISQKHSEKNGFTFYIGIPKSIIAQQANSSLRLSFLLTGLLIAAGILIVLIAYWYNQRPLKNIIDKTRRIVVEDTQQTNLFRNELWSLANTISFITQSNLSMEKQLKIQEVALEKATLIQLVHGELIIPLSEKQDSQSEEYDLRYRGMYLGIVQTQESPSFLETQEVLSKVLGKFAATLTPCFWADAVHFAILYHETIPTSLEVYQSFLKDLHFLLLSEYQLEVVFYVGAPYTDLEEVHLSFSEARRILSAQNGSILCLCPETGISQSLPSKQSEKGTVFDLNFAPDQAYYIILNETAPPRMLWDVVEQVNVAGPWDVLPLGEDYKYQQEFPKRTSRLRLPMATFSSELSLESKYVRIANRRDEVGFCGRHLSLWSGSWLTRRFSWLCSPYETDLYYRKIISLPESVLGAKVSIAAISEFTLFINGTPVVQKRSDGQVETLEIGHHLQPGENLIAVHVHLDNPLNANDLNAVDELPGDRLISLLLQGEVQTADGNHSFQTDRSWIVNNRWHEGWEELGQQFETTAIRSQASKYKGFGEGVSHGTWVYGWERGTPPMEPWGDRPLYGQELSFPLELSYGIVLPKGTCEIQKPQVLGAFSCTLDGMPIRWENDSLSVLPSARTRQLQIFVTATSREDGLLHPLEVNLAPYLGNVGDWRGSGLDWFSGYVLYENEFQAPAGHGRYRLDLGRVHFSAEIWINGVRAGTRIWEPYTLDITDYITEGINKIAIVVANSAAVERQFMLVDEGQALGWNRYWNEDNMHREGENLISGLLGPVRVFCETSRQEESLDE